MVIQNNKQSLVNVMNQSSMSRVPQFKSLSWKVCSSKIDS